MCPKLKIQPFSIGVNEPLARYLWRIGAERPYSVLQRASSKPTFHQQRSHFWFARLYPRTHFQFLSNPGGARLAEAHQCSNLDYVGWFLEYTAGKNKKNVLRIIASMEIDTDMCGKCWMISLFPQCHRLFQQDRICFGLKHRNVVKNAFGFLFWPAFVLLIEGGRAKGQAGPRPPQ